MILKELTVKKGYLTSITTKDANGGYNKNENSAEVAMTFSNEGTPIDEKEAQQKVRDAVKKLFNDDPDWIDQPQLNEK